MASGITRRGARRRDEVFFQGVAAPANFFVAFVTSATTPTIDTVTLSQLTEVAQGAGYSSGGFSVARNTTDWPTIVENDGSTNLVKTIAKDWGQVAVGAGVTFPLSGSGARYAVLLGPHATPGSREVWAWFDLVSDKTVSEGQELKVDDPYVATDVTPA